MLKKLLIITIFATNLLFAFESHYLPGYDIDAQCDKILHKTKMDICYSYKKKEPLMVIYSADKQNLSKPKLKRKGLTFKPDYQIKTKYRSYTKDYAHTGYDRGHNAPNAMFNYDKKLQKETFLMSNISPQKPRLNRGIWAKIERFARLQAMKYGHINIIMGSCQTVGHIKNGVNIPKYFYKIIFRPKEQPVAFLLENTNNYSKKDKLKKYLSSIKTIEATCGIKIKK